MTDKETEWLEARRKVWSMNEAQAALDGARDALRALLSGNTEAIQAVAAKIDSEINLHEAGMNLAIQNAAEGREPTDSDAANFMRFVISVGLLHVLGGLIEEVEADRGLSDDAPPEGVVLQ